MSETISTAEFEALDWAIRAPMRMIEAWSLKDLAPHDAKNVGEALMALNAARAKLYYAQQAANIFKDATSNGDQSAKAEGGKE